MVTRAGRGQNGPWAAFRAAPVWIMRRMPGAVYGHGKGLLMRGDVGDLCGVKMRVPSKPV